MLKILNYSESESDDDANQASTITTTTTTTTTPIEETEADDGGVDKRKSNLSVSCLIVIFMYLDF